MSIRINQVPGFCGIIGGEESAKSRQSLERMLHRLVYGGRTIAGTYENATLGLNIGWTRPQEYQGPDLPVWNQDKSIGLFILGEICRDTEVSGLPGTGNSDWEGLIQCYEREGTGCLEQLNGWFGGVLIDLRQQQAVLFNDRYGLFRIHYHQDSQGFHFSSEAKGILASVPATRQLDLKSLAEFMSCGCTMQDRSMFSGVSLLPGASAWRFRPHGKMQREFYFDCEDWEQQGALEFSEWFERLKETWVRILPRYLKGERIGLSLTGGVDSRMILAWAPQTAKDLVCYTFAGKYRDSMDIAVSRQLARICGRPHETIYVDEEFLSAFPDLAAQCVFLSDGTMDVTGSIDLYVQSVARQIAPVRVTGTNGGEIMRSLVAFKPGGVSPEPFAPDFGNTLHAAAATYSRQLCENRLSFTAFKQVPWYMNTKFSVERSQITLRMPYFDNDLVSLIYRAPANLPQNSEVALRLIADGNPLLGKVGTDRGLSFRAAPWRTLPRHLYQQFTFKLEYAYDYGMPHWLAQLDHLVSPLRLERHILGRHKFHHFRVWYRDRLSGYLKDILLDGRTLTRPYLRGSAIEKMVRAHIAGTRNYTREFHKILSAELIQRQFIEQNS